MTDDGLTQRDLSAYLRRLAALELHPAAEETAPRLFLRGRASALFAIANLVERGEIRDAILAELPIHRLHVQPDAYMPED